METFPQRRRFLENNWARSGGGCNDVSIYLCGGSVAVHFSGSSVHFGIFEYMLGVDQSRIRCVDGLDDPDFSVTSLVCASACSNPGRRGSHPSEQVLPATPVATRSPPTEPTHRPVRKTSSAIQHQESPVKAQD